MKDFITMIRLLAGRASKRLVQTSLSSRIAGGSAHQCIPRSNVISKAMRSSSTNVTPILATQCNESQGQNVAWLKTVASITTAGVLMAGGMMDDKTRCCGIVGVIGTDQYDARYVYTNDIIIIFLFI